MNGRKPRIGKGFKIKDGKITPVTTSRSASDAIARKCQERKIAAMFDEDGNLIVALSEVATKALKKWKRVRK